MKYIFSFFFLFISFFSVEAYSIRRVESYSIRWAESSMDPQNQYDQYDQGMKFYEAKNYTKAIEWLAKSAEQGHDDAKNKLGMMYLKGEGTPRNIVEARKWLPLHVILDHSTPFKKEKLEALEAAEEAKETPCHHRFS